MKRLYWNLIAVVVIIFDLIMMIFTQETLFEFILSLVSLVLMVLVLISNFIKRNKKEKPKKENKLVNFLVQAGFVIIALVISYFLNGIGATIKIALVALGGWILCILVNLFTKKAKDETKLKIVKTFQFVGFGIFGLWAILSLFGFEFVKDIFFFSIMTSITCVLISIYLKRKIKKKSSIGLSLEEKVKNDLKVTSKTHTKEFPKALNWIGGFVMPVLPLFSVINKKWKKKLTKEAVIHENVHLYYLQNGLIFALFFGSVAISGLVLWITKISTLWLHLPLIWAITLCFMVWFEYITFNKTNEIGKKFKIKTRKWSSRQTKMYFIIYAIQLGIIFGVVIGLQHLIKFLIHLI